MMLLRLREKSSQSRWIYSTALRDANEMYTTNEVGSYKISFSISRRRKK